MNRLALSACVLALGLAALPASAQVGVPALPRALPEVPAVGEQPFPGVIGLEVDATDLERKIIRVRQTIPVPAAGPMSLYYPKFLPGNHAPTGPIQLIAGLTVTGGGERIEWLRDTIDPYVFHIDVPAGVNQIEVAFQWLTQPDNSEWRVVMTQEIINHEWEKALLYPAGYRSDAITFAPSIRLPQGWNYGVALETESFENGVARFKPVDLYTLVDSPMFAGAHYRRIDIGRDSEIPVHVSVVADEASMLADSPKRTAQLEDLVLQADRLFGARHYDRYEFLVAATSRLGGIGLEHHRSSENTVGTNYFTEGGSYGSRSLLPHEYVHSWNGKFKRPSDQMTRHYNEPVQNTLLWVYEGQTEYWGEVLTARSGLATKEEALANLAEIAAFYQYQPGREWRALQDTTNHNLLGYRVPGQWPSWMRTTGDYYREALLIWLDADTLIREATDGRKSLDDFAKAFFGGESGAWRPEGYTFDELVAALNAVHPHDWRTFLRDRLDAVGPEARAPLDGIERGGYRLVYVDKLNDVEKSIQSGWANDFQYSLGFNLSGPTNRITGVRWGGPFYDLGLGVGWELVAVGDQAASPAHLREAITAAKGGTTPIRLTIKNGDRFRTLDIPYHDGLRYPRLERVPGTPDRLGDILAPRRR